MQPPLPRIIYIDDDENDRSRYAGVLGRTGLVEAVPMPNPRDLADISGLLDEAVDLYLIDYELVRSDEQGRHSNYGGATLISRLIEARTRRLEVPMVVFTREAIAGRVDRSRLETLVDEFVMKGSIDRYGPEVATGVLCSLVDGFRRLREPDLSTRTWTRLLEILSATGAEAAAIKEAGPPLTECDMTGHGTHRHWHVAPMARWIRRVLLKYPGIVYDDLHAATFLGVTRESFLQDRVQTLFQTARYSGPFAAEELRWWKLRLLDIAMDILVERDMLGPIRPNFCSALELEAAQCSSGGESPPERVCYVLHTPVSINRSLRFLPDSRPAVMDGARISFKAIREENIDESAVHEDDRSLIAGVKDREKGHQ